MTFDEVHGLPEPTIILCADNMAGILIGWPRGGHQDEPCRVQVPGEEEARTIHHSRLHFVGRNVIEEGADLDKYLAAGRK